MHINDQEYIGMEPFDREYGLHELLPLTTLRSLCADAAALLPPDMIVLGDDGTVYFQQSEMPDEQTAAISKIVSQDPPQDNTYIKMGCDLTARVFPIIHELETKGYVVLPQVDLDGTATDSIGKSICAVLLKMMNLTYRNKLTSGLHGTVVEESYGQLKEKAAQLALSEEKYRALAAGLEIEVEQKTAEIRRTHAHMMQQEKMAAIGQLSAGMAHEINNPLGFVISNLETLKEYATDLDALLAAYHHLYQLCCEPTPNQAMTKQCQTIQELDARVGGAFLLEDLPKLADESMHGAQRIKKIIADLKIVARPGETDPERINIHKSIDAVLTILDNRIGPQISVVKQYDAIRQIFGHPQEINQIWLNLVLNALDAMGDRGTLSIATHSHENQTLVTIKDTGQGIEESQLSKIFDPFYTSKQVGSGMGLGLHLVFNIVEKHQGRIDVESQVGKGSIFTVCLPSERQK